MDEAPTPHEWISFPGEAGRFCRHCGAVEASRVRRVSSCPGPVAILARLGMVSPDAALNLHPRDAKSLVGYIERFSSSYLSVPSRVSKALMPRATPEQKTAAREIIDEFFHQVRNFGHLVPGALLNDPHAKLSPDYDVPSDCISPSRRILLASSAMRFIDAAIPLGPTILEGLQPRPRAGAKSRGMTALADAVRAYGTLHMDVERSRPVKLVAS